MSCYLRVPDWASEFGRGSLNLVSLAGSRLPGQDGKASRGGWESDVVGPKASAVSLRKDIGWRRRGREPEGDPSVQGSVVVRHQSAVPRAVAVQVHITVLVCPRFIKA